MDTIVEPKRVLRCKGKGKCKGDGEGKADFVIYFLGGCPLFNFSAWGFLSGYVFNATVMPAHGPFTLYIATYMPAYPKA